MTNPNPITPPDRHPLARIARHVGTAKAVIGAALAAAATAGLVATDLPGAVDGVLHAVLVLLAAALPLWAVDGVRRQAEPVVTPVADPRDNAGRLLRPVQLGSDGVYRVTGLHS